MPQVPPAPFGFPTMPKGETSSAPPTPAAPNAPPPDKMPEVPTAPPPPTVIGQEELRSLCAMLEESDSNQRIIRMRAWLNRKKVLPSQLKDILSCFSEEMRGKALNDLFDSDTIDDSQGTFMPTLLNELSSGFIPKDDWKTTVQKCQAVMTGPGPQANPTSVPQALQGLDPEAGWEAPAPFVVVIHPEGSFSTISCEMKVMTLKSALKQAGFDSGLDFHTEAHAIFMDKGKGDMQSKMAAQITSSVLPGELTPVQLDQSLEQLGAVVGTRLVWQKRVGLGTPVRGATQRGIFAKSYSFFYCINSMKDGQISKADIRNLLWNMNLDSQNFQWVWSCLDRREQGHLDIDDMLFFLGRASMMHPDVPVDALFMQGVRRLLGSPPMGYFDQDPNEEKSGVGYSKALAQECSGCRGHTFLVLIVLQIAVFAIVVLSILTCISPTTWDRISPTKWDQKDTEHMYICMLFLVVFYLFCICTSKTSSALSNATEGLAECCEKLDVPRYENPHFSWHIQCYHYEERIEIEHYRDKDGNAHTRQVRKQVRINTHFANAGGEIPSSDRTPFFVPNTGATSTQVDTEESHDFSESNYLWEYHAWVSWHYRDQFADFSRSERIPSRCDSILAVWLPGTTPWWMSWKCMCCVSLMCLHACYRIKMLSHIERQEYTYRKKCYNIRRPPWGGPFDYLWGW